jgi:SAM-dependent methyltransferase
MRYSKPKPPKFTVLEVGCGAGANIPFFRNFDFLKYFGIDGSPTIIEKLRERYPDLRDQLIVSDFTKSIPFEENFDLIIDRASLTCNTTEAIQRALSLIYDKLKLDGKMISVDMYSTEYSEFKKGQAAEDNYTRKNYENGPFAHSGRVHFSNKSHLLDLFKKFSIIYLEHKVHKTEIPKENFAFASWNLAAQKNI